MKGDWFDIFYAAFEFREEFRTLVYHEGKGIADSVFCLKSEGLHHNVLLVDHRARYPLTVFLRPDLEAQMKKKAKSCCDKACNSCVIGCLDTPSVGFLIKERMKNYFKKDSHLRGLYRDEIPDTLRHLKLEGYILEDKELHVILEDSGFEPMAGAGSKQLPPVRSEIDSVTLTH